MSRLQAPTVFAGAGLTELSESQHNVRAYTSIPAPPTKGIKREIPQPGTASMPAQRPAVVSVADQYAAAQSDPKRKPLSERAVEYPAKQTSAASGQIARPNIKGQTLAGISQVSSAPCQPAAIFVSSNQMTSCSRSSKPPVPTGCHAQPPTHQPLLLAASPRAMALVGTCQVIDLRLLEQTLAPAMSDQRARLPYDREQPTAIVMTINTRQRPTRMVRVKIPDSLQIQST